MQGYNIIRKRVFYNALHWLGNAAKACGKPGEHYVYSTHNVNAEPPTVRSRFFYPQDIRLDVLSYICIYLPISVYTYVSV